MDQYSIDYYRKGNYGQSSSAFQYNQQSIYPSRCEERNMFLMGRYHCPDPETQIGQALKFIMAIITKKSKYNELYSQASNKSLIVKQVEDLIHRRLSRAMSKIVSYNYKDLLRYYRGMFSMYLDGDVKNILKKLEQPSKKILKADAVLPIFQERIEQSLRENIQDIIKDLKNYEKDAKDQLPNREKLDLSCEKESESGASKNVRDNINKSKVDGKNTEYQKAKQEYNKMIDKLLEKRIVKFMKNFKKKFNSTLYSDEEFIKAQARVIIETKDKIRNEIYKVNTKTDVVRDKKDVKIDIDKKDNYEKDIEIVDDEIEIVGHKIETVEVEIETIGDKIEIHSERIETVESTIEIVDDKIETVEDTNTVEINDDSDVEIIDNKFDKVNDIIVIDDDDDVVNIGDSEPNNAKIKVPQPKILKTANTRRSMLFAMVIGRPRLPSEWITMKFLMRFNPGRIHSHVSIVNVLLVSFNRKKDLDDIVKANGSQVGGAVLIVRPWNPEGNDRNNNRKTVAWTANIKATPEKAAKRKAINVRKTDVGCKRRTISETRKLNVAKRKISDGLTDYRETCKLRKVNNIVDKHSTNIINHVDVPIEEDTESVEENCVENLRDLMYKKVMETKIGMPDKDTNCKLLKYNEMEAFVSEQTQTRSVDVAGKEKSKEVSVENIENEMKRIIEEECLKKLNILKDNILNLLRKDEDTNMVKTLIINNVKDIIKFAEEKCITNSNKILSNAEISNADSLSNSNDDAFQISQDVTEKNCQHLETNASDYDNKEIDTETSIAIHSLADSTEDAFLENKDVTEKNCQQLGESSACDSNNKEIDMEVSIETNSFEDAILNTNVAGENQLNTADASDSNIMEIETEASDAHFYSIEEMRALKLNYLKLTNNDVENDKKLNTPLGKSCENTTSVEDFAERDSEKQLIIDDEIGKIEEIDAKVENVENSSRNINADSNNELNTRKEKNI